MIRNTTLIQAILLAIFVWSCQSAAEKATADLIITNAKVYTVDEAQPEASAVAVKDGRILAV
ncbi:MAG: hypothetical protein AAFR36_24760, partial [Bacteroidota bacterium]